MVARKKTVKRATKATKKTTPRAKSKLKLVKGGKKPKTRSKKPPTTAKKLSKIAKAYTQSELFNVLAERTEISKKDIVNLFAELKDIIEGHLKKGSIGKFILPKILKMTVKKVAAKKARKGINPFTGEKTTFKAKPASKKVKITPLKDLKEMVS